MSLKGFDGCRLFGVRDGDKFVGVATATGCKPNDFSKLCKLLSNFPKRFHVQVEEGDAVQAVHITVDVPRRCRREEEIFSEKFRHFAQRKRVETVETILCSLFLPKPNEDVPFLFAECPPNTDNFSKFSKIVSDLLLTDVAVFVEEGETVIAKDVFLDVAIELDKAIVLA